MNCTKCGAGDSIVTDSRERDFTIRRKRKCRSCGHGWWTIEIESEELKRGPKGPWKHKTAA